MLVHLNMLGFTLRLGCSLFWITKKTQQTIKHRLALALKASNHQHGGNQTQLNLSKPLEEKESENSSHKLIHAIILPNFGEDVDVLRATLKVLASHPRAQSQYEVTLSLSQTVTRSPDNS
ncbi:uncharacterized protein N7498_001938 [Penicillium cinerascens]|uniref:Glycosyltransferase 2-like domain-containing protein n=1 Tax=Penicillium cinerascens TaxID=70096 RepID=A0A9W9N962_9EURO|nr:uncharacterized protein N7498_001938 [Penicillium cinerascens]KAJ5215531.1 hypothetical protein N7498_001938 [Penicillium cinerascens]